eukprot:4431992-Pleurochrysis_carterae.AAC.1
MQVRWFQRRPWSKFVGVSVEPSADRKRSSCCQPSSRSRVSTSLWSRRSHERAFIRALVRRSSAGTPLIQST